MGRNKEYTSDAVKDSVQAAMAEITAYFDKNWAPGREYDVIKHVHSLLDAEIDKYVAPAEAGNAYRHLAVYAPGSKKYAAVHARNLEKYGPYLMELFVEYADSLKLTGRYDVGERYNEVSRDVLDKMKKDPTYFTQTKAIFRHIIEEFAAIPRREEQKVRVGIVGEIYVKFSPLGNNHLEQLLVDEGAEVVTPGLFDFLTFGLYVKLVDTKLYGIGKARYPFILAAYRILLSKQKELIDVMKADGRFRAPTPFEHIVELSHEVVDNGVKMGEGWLLPAEMLELNDSGVHNVVCAQPFGCLPNHIVGKGMMKPIKEKHPEINLVAIDYDSGATRVNQENRIRLMLSNAAR